MAVAGDEASRAEARPFAGAGAAAGELDSVHAALSQTHRRFVRYACGEPACLSRATFGVLDEPTDHFRPYPLQSWPTFVSARLNAEMSRLSVELSRLVKAVPRRVFDLDPARVDRFYGLDDRALTALTLEEPNGFDGALVRGDFILTDGGLRCLELNVAAQLAGWYTSIFAPRYLEIPVLRRFVEQQELAPRAASPVRVLFDHLVEEALAGVAAGDGEVNCAIVLAGDLHLPAVRAFRRFAEPEYRSALARLGPGRTGSLLFCGYRDLVERGGYLRCGARRVHAVIELVIELGEAATGSQAVRCLKAGTVSLYNGLAPRVLNDKRNLALLSELEEDGPFTPEEAELVRASVPWTRRVAPRYTHYRGERVYLPDFLLGQRRRLVLKPALGSQGDDVTVGPFTPQAEWAGVVRRALDERVWIAQEHVESKPYLYQHGEHGCVPHDLVWGLFVFGRRFGGTYLRMLPRGSSGVINAYRGAMEGVVFEVDEE